MLNDQSVAPEERGKLLLKWRTTLGWNIGEAAKRIGVSTRTISSIESGAQIMTDSRWRLFVHEMIDEIERGAFPELVVVISNSKMQVPLDVVASSNYAGFAIGEDGKTAMIASYSINRVSGAPEVHRQSFFVESNQHVMRAIERWEGARQVESSDRSAFEMHRWLMRRVLEGELANPKLITLKAAIREAKAKVDQADDASEEVREQLMNKLDAAVTDLMEAVAKAAKN